MQTAIIVFPGSNCDRDMGVAMGASLAAQHKRPPLMVWHGDSTLPSCDLIILPGGFSYGDYLRCGAMAANSPIMRDVVARAKQGVPVLGVCNGFQILIECGLLPGALMRNRDLNFICRDVGLRVEKSWAPFTDKYGAGEEITMPIAHHDGNYFADKDMCKRLQDNEQIAFTYLGDNPNGSVLNIAGIFNESGTILGMMPHPERLADVALGGEDAKRLFVSLAEIAA